MEAKDIIEMYDLKINNKPCVKCGKELEFSEVIYFEEQGMIGVKHPLHECGKQYQRTILVPCTEKSKDWWVKTVDSIRDNNEIY